MSNVVPKFGSFKPKPQLEPEPEQEPEQEPANREDASVTRRVRTDASKHHERRHGSKARSRHERHRRHASSRQLADEAVVSKDRSSLAIHPAVDSSSVFRSDLEGDANNLVYGTIHRYSVPAYHRVGAGSVIGLPTRCKIDRDFDPGQGLLVRDRSRLQAGRRERYVFARTEKKPPKKLRILQVDGPRQHSEPEEDFVPLKRPSSSRRLRSESPNDLSLDERHHYRSIEGKAKAAAEPDDVDLRYEGDSTDSDYEKIDLDGQSEESRRRHAELRRQTEEDPGNVQSWIDLVQHQGLVLDRDFHAQSRVPTAAERLSVADIKLSIYSKALEKVASDADGRDRLLLGMMEEGSKIWESKKQATKWLDILKANPARLRLWTRYLDFVQTNFNTFRYEEVRDKFRDCLQRLDSFRDSAAQCDTSKPDIEKIMVYVLLRCTLLMREAGFQENALSIWQALLEIHFFAPESANSATSHSSIWTEFEEFWESELPRIGEVDAHGWKNSSGERRRPEAEADVQNAASRESSTNPLLRWFEEEKLQMVKSTFPARTTDEDADEDPYRVILFADIKDFLVRLTTTHAREHLVAALLAFCRLPPCTSEEDDVRPYWWTDSFVRGDALDMSDSFLTSVLTPTTTLDLSSDTDGGRGNSCTSSGHVFRNFLCSPDTLFSRDPIFSVLPHMTGGDAESMLSWTLNALKSLVLAEAGGAYLAEYLLALTAKYRPDGARKLAKTFLKKHPSNLRLYNALALIEWRLGNLDKARNIFGTALKMSGTVDEANRQDQVLLHRTWTWELLLSGHAIEAWQILMGGEDSGLEVDISVDLADVTKSKPGVTLKARRGFEAGIHHALTKSNPRHVVYHTDCLALMAYLSTSNEPLTSALQVYENSTKQLDQKSPRPVLTIELLHQSRTLLLHHHMTTARAFRPAQIREALITSIRLFPNNTLFLDLYALNESRFRIDNRVRTVMQDVILRDQHDTVVTWLFAAMTEIHSVPGTGRNEHSVLALFERAVSSSSSSPSTTTPLPQASTTAHNPSIWTLYIHYSALHDRPPFARTKAVVYRAMRACPWVKAFYLRMFALLGGVHEENQETKEKKEMEKEKEREMGKVKGGEKQKKRGEREEIQRGMDDATRRELTAVYAGLADRELRVHVEMET